MTHTVTIRDYHPNLSDETDNWWELTLDGADFYGTIELSGYVFTLYTEDGYLANLPDDEVDAVIAATELYLTFFDRDRLKQELAILNESARWELAGHLKLNEAG